MSPELIPVIVLALFAAATVFFLIIRRRLRKRRQSLIRQQALKMGLRPALNPDGILAPIWQQRFLVLSTERKMVGRGVENLLEGYVGSQRVYLFDFEVNIPRETNAWQTVLIVQADKSVWPKFALHPRKLKKERFTQRMRTALQEFASKGITGYRKCDVRIDGYQLSCPEGAEQAVRNLFSPDVAGYFSNNRKYAVEGSPNYLLVYEREQTVAPGSLEQFIDHTMLICRLFTRASGVAAEKRAPATNCTS